jgi:hypothetical protein
MPSSTLTLAINTGAYSNNLWTSPANGLVSNNAYASNAPGVTGNRYFTYDTNAAALIPAGAVIVGVWLQVEHRVSATALGPNVMGAPGTSSGVAAPGGGQSAINGLTTDTVHSWGGPTNPLGATSVADLATLVVRISQTTAGAVTHFLDNATMVVDWVLPSGANVLFFGENF